MDDSEEAIRDEAAHQTVQTVTVYKPTRVFHVIPVHSPSKLQRLILYVNLTQL